MELLVKKYSNHPGNESDLDIIGWTVGENICNCLSHFNLSKLTIVIVMFH